MQQSEVAINYWELDFGFVFELSSIKYDDGSNLKDRPVYLGFRNSDVIFLLGGFGYKNLNFFLDKFFSMRILWQGPMELPCGPTEA